jgi:hypothetical protein
MPPPDRKPKPRTLKIIAIIALAFIAATIALIFIGENISHKKVLDDAKRTNPEAIG